MATEQPTTASRPSGEDRAEYKRYDRWSYRRWAWEFLRRNPNFMAACNAAGEDDDLRAQVAQDYQLKRFKHFNEAWKAGSGKALFLSSSVSFFTSADDDDERRLRTRLRPGEVLLRVRLSTTMHDKQALDAQLRAVAKIVRREQRAYLAHVRAEEATVHAAKPQGFLRALRLADLLDGRNGADVAVLGRALRIANGRGPKSLTMALVSRGDALEDMSAHREFRKQLAPALELVKTGYRFLANRPGRPEPKSFA